MLTTDTPQTIHLKDYRPSPYSIESVNLEFSLDPEQTRVTSHLVVKPNPAGGER